MTGLSNPSPTLVGPYQLLAEIGQGGMGTVYRARDTRSGQQVALKVLSPYLSQSQKFVQRFWDEYASLRGLRHPNIVQVYDFGQAGGLYYIAAEYVEGESLEHRLARGWRPGIRLALTLVRQVAAALDAAHQRGIVHRDLKPGNILLGRRGRVVLTDFGIAHLLRASRSAHQTDPGLGTPEYMAPEQARGSANVDHRADIYSLGVLTYRLLGGHSPFEREQTLAMLHAHVYETPPPLRHWRPDLPPGVEQVVMWALAKDPNRRPRTAGEFARHLEAASGVASTPAPRPRLEPWLIGVAGIAVVIVLTGLLVLSAGSSPGTTLNNPEGPDRLLVYTCQASSEEQVHLCLREPDGRLRVLVFGDYDWGAAWAPDGQRLAFVSGSKQDWDIWLLDVRQRQASGLIVGRGHHTAPSWSPDGRFLAFDSNRAGPYDVYRYDVQSEQSTALTHGRYRDSDPAWSPGGGHIAFVSDRDGDMEIYVMAADGSDQTRLTHHSGWDFGPAWSPDGHQLAYECGMGDHVEICAIDADGTHQRRLTDTMVDDRQPAWSPDGSTIIFSRQRTGDGQWDLWVMNTDGSGQRVWVRDERSNTQPAWQP